MNTGIDLAIEETTLPKKPGTSIFFIIAHVTNEAGILAHQDVSIIKRNTCEQGGLNTCTSRGGDKKKEAPVKK